MSAKVVVFDMVGRRRPARSLGRRRALRRLSPTTPKGPGWRQHHSGFGHSSRQSPAGASRCWRSIAIASECSCTRSIAVSASTWPQASAMPSACRPSMSSPQPSWRWIEPHAYAFDGFRWHVRAFCRRDGAYKDFLLSRIISTHADVQPIPATSSGAQDVEWHTEVTLVIGPHPGLSEGQ